MQMLINQVSNAPNTYLDSMDKEKVKFLTFVDGEPVHWELPYSNIIHDMDFQTIARGVKEDRQ